MNDETEKKPKSKSKKIAKELAINILTVKNENEDRNKKQMLGKDLLSAIKANDPIKLIDVLKDCISVLG